MKQLLKCICFLLIISMVIPYPVSAQSSNTRASNYFACSSVYLYKTSDTTFQAWFDVTALGYMDELGACEIQIQRSKSGSTWLTFATVTKESNTNLVKSNALSYASCVSYTGTVGYYYRAIITLYAKNSSGSAEMVEYTAILQL